MRFSEYEGHIVLLVPVSFGAHRRSISMNTYLCPTPLIQRILNVERLPFSSRIDPYTGARRSRFGCDTRLGHQYGS